MDNIDLDREYSEIYLRKKIEELNKDKSISGKSISGADCTIEYSLESLMSDLLGLLDNEKTFKKAVKNGYAMTLVVTDEYQVITWSLSKTYQLLSDKEIIKKLDREIKQAKSKMYDNKETKVKIYRSLDDFNIGEKISLEDIKR